MTCLENSGKCNAACCRGFFLPIKTEALELAEVIRFKIGNITPDMKRYYELHEGVVYKKGMLDVWARDVKTSEKFFEINAKCKMLIDCKCKIYYRNRPQICIDGYTKIKEGVRFPEGCIYSRV